jgi:hypothetical protein
MPGHTRTSLARTSLARTSLARALGHASRLTRRYLSGEHLMTVLVSAVSAGRDPRPARAVLHSCGATLEDVAAEIARRAGPGAVLFGGLDQDALAAIGIDLDAVRARIGSSFGPEALTEVAEGCEAGLGGGEEAAAVDAFGAAAAALSGLLFAQQVEHDVLDNVVGFGCPDHGPDPPGQGHAADRLIELHGGPGEPAVQDLIVGRGKVDCDPDGLYAGLPTRLRGRLPRRRSVRHERNLLHVLQSDQARSSVSPPPSHARVRAAERHGLITEPAARTQSGG